MITLTTYKWVPDFAQPLMRAFRVRWALEEAGIPYEVRFVTLGAEQSSPEHLARQPFGQAPAIEDNGLVLHESGAIALYMVAVLHGTAGGFSNVFLVLAGLACTMLVATFFFPSRAELTARREKLASQPA